LRGGFLTVERLEGRRIDRLRFTPEAVPEPISVVETKSDRKNVGDK
jgi:hypothetical protein